MVHLRRQIGEGLFINYESNIRRAAGLEIFRRLLGGNGFAVSALRRSRRFVIFRRAEKRRGKNHAFDNGRYIHRTRSGSVFDVCRRAVSAEKALGLGL